MNEYIEVISQIKPKNNGNFPIADVNDLKGGYIQVQTIQEMNEFPISKLKEGMLCYVAEDNHMYQFRNNVWAIWIVESSSGAAIVKVVSELTDLENEELKIQGQLVFVQETKDIRYYNGQFWETFSKIYIQSTEPDDKGGIWIDTSENKEYLSSNTVIQDLLKVINILQARVNKLEYALNCQMDSGDFTNNQFNIYNGAENEEPNYGTSVEDDEMEQANNQDIVLADSPEPTNYNNYIPNLKHLCIKAGTYAEMVANQNDFLPKELLWCTDKQSLYIKDPKTLKLVVIGSSGGDTPIIPDDDMDGIITEIINGKTKISGIEFIDINNKNNTYTIQIKDGALDVKDNRLYTNSLAGNAQTVSTGEYYSNAYFPIAADKVGSTDSPKIYINSVYCGNEGDSLSYNPVSHNFVELSNLGNADLNLKGLYLHYTERDSGYWVTLPLIGVIKAGNTFLIKGAQCSVENINTTVIKVGEPDMYWTKDATYSSTALEIEGERTLWDDKGLIKFSNTCAFYISGEESEGYFKENTLQLSAPWTTNGVVKWYVDLVGIGSYNGKQLPNEKAAITTTGNNILYHRYYNMDNVKQATKALRSRSNSTDWTYINLSNINPEINIEDYVPKNSKQNKTIFFNKTLLSEDKPNIITCTFGYNAHTTRCFTWVSVGYYDEYIQIRKDGESYTNMYESFKEGDGRPDTKNWQNKIYNRIRSITTDGTAFTTHKFIMDFEEPVDTQVYYYKVGREGHWSDERSFTLRSRQSVIDNGFQFLQISDQQGFNGEEYKTWEVAGDFIKNNESYEWILNTGDQTQNGNRINEWLDYYKTHIYDDKEQMFTVGNNDLCPLDVYTLGNGSDISKTNPINVEYFFTFEHPYDIPMSSTGVYVPCVYSFIYGNTYFLSMNSEITDVAREQIYGDVGGENVYDKLKIWAQNDLGNLDETIVHKVAFCHEAPFTIITADLILKYTKNNSTLRGGSHLNTVGNYWFSQFLQNNGFKLCLCGHKHTYANSRPIHEDAEHTMVPIVYDENPSPDWYTSLPTREQGLCAISTDSSLGFVRYVMCQATGYKLVSNKELPAQNIPWLMEYYPVTKQTEDQVSNTASVTANAAQKFPNYIIWNIGVGNETETGTQEEPRQRILGKSYKLKLTSSTAQWAYKYNVPISYTDLSRVGGNGSTNPDNNIVV